MPSWSLFGFNSTNNNDNNHDYDNNVSDTKFGSYSINTKNITEINSLEKKRDDLRKQLETADFNIKGDIFNKTHELNDDIEKLNKGNTIYHKYGGGKCRSKRRNSKKTTSKKGKKNRKSNKKTSKK